MKTYVRLYFGTVNMNPTEVATKLAAIGLIPSVGKEDFHYDWGDNTLPRTTEILAFGDKVMDMLKGSGCVFKLNTY